MRQRLKSDFWDGSQVHKRGSVVDWPTPLAFAEPVSEDEPEKPAAKVKSAQVNK